MTDAQAARLAARVVDADTNGDPQCPCCQGDGPQRLEAYAQTLADMIEVVGPSVLRRALRIVVDREKAKAPATPPPARPH